MAYLKDRGSTTEPSKWRRAKGGPRPRPQVMGPAFSKTDGTNKVKFPGSENIFVR